MDREYLYKGIILFLLITLLITVFDSNFDLWIIRRNFVSVKYQPEINKYAQKFDHNLIKSLAAYNAGENNVRKWISQGWEGNIEKKLPFAETNNFVRRVISTHDYYKKN